MKKNNIKKTIIFSFIFCILIIILLLFIILKKSSILNENMDSYEIALEKANEELLEKKEIVPDNFNFLERLYEGDVQSTYIYSQIYQVVFETIPEIYDKLNNCDEEIVSNYYTENSENIFNKLGIDNKEQFIKFAKAICKLKNIKYDSSIFDIKTLQSNDEYSNLNLQINFEDENQIVFNFYIINKQEEGKTTLRFLIN